MYVKNLYTKHSTSFYVLCTPKGTRLPPVYIIISLADQTEHCSTRTIPSNNLSHNCCGSCSSLITTHTHTHTPPFHLMGNICGRKIKNILLEHPVGSVTRHRSNNNKAGDEQQQMMMMKGVGWRRIGRKVLSSTCLSLLFPHSSPSPSSTSLLSLWYQRTRRLLIYTTLNNSWSFQMC